MRVEAHIQTTIELIDTILSNPSIPADSLINTYFRNHRFIGSSDRRVIAELLYGILRQLPRLQWLCPNIDGRKAILLYLTTVKNEPFEKVSKLFKGERFTPCPLTVEEKQHLKSIQTLKEPMPEWAKLAVPEWLWSYFEQLFADGIKEELIALNEQAPLDLRVNTLKTNRKLVLKQLLDEGFDVKPTPLSPYGLRLSQRFTLPSHPLWKDGTLEVQDEGSQLIALLCSAQPGMSVLDYCAGAGGKSLVLSEAMQNKGRLVLSDIHDWRLKRAKERLRRAGIHNHETRLIAEKEWFKRQENRFDRVLVDAPCSGTGTWRRNPDMKIKFKEHDLKELVKKQQEILESASKLVKKGGWLIYSTCSLLRNENHEQIEWFLKNNPSFSLMSIKDIWSNVIKDTACPTSESVLQLTPASNGTDGFFVGILMRK